MPGMNLTLVEAQKRAETIKGPVEYEVKLALGAQGDTFPTQTVIKFSAEPGAATFVDLVADQVHRVVLNGVELPASEVYVDHRIELKNLAAENVLEVNADCVYMHTGEGMHRFQDPADQLSYVYTQFEVPDARRVFPCFEQPDLKGRFTFQVTVPQDWVVLSNEPTPAPKHNPETPEGHHVFEFGQTDPISTYITAFVAGPYHEVRDEWQAPDGRKIGMGVYCRQSLQEYLDADWVLDITKAGFAFYENEFSTPYPFKKYDQIFVPEFNAGAMENAGCVTIRDEYVFRSKPTQERLEVLADTVLHELAHMWFGDLVTMKWWDDLWLNESFAEFMSYLAMAEATQYTEGWNTFSVRKLWGLKCDQRSTTHPILAEIKDLHDVEVNFDGITYSKGGCVLRQLVAFVGRENFRQALANYFKKYAFSNATLTDFLEQVQQASGKDLDPWVKVWLLEAGITQLNAELVRNEDGTVNQYRIVQTLPQAGTSLRPHSLYVGCYDFSEAGKLVLTRTVEVQISADSPLTVVEELTGTKHAVYVLNDQDVAYAKIRLDDESLSLALANIGEFEDSMPRTVIMCAAWDAMRDGDLPASVYVELALLALESETNSSVVGQIIRDLGTAVEFYSADLERNRRLAAAGLLVLAKQAEGGSDRQRQLFKGWMQVCGANEVTELKHFYQAKQALPGLVVDTDLLWEMAETLASLGALDQAGIDDMLASDDTLTGRENALQAGAARPDVEVKREVFAQVMNDQTLPNGQLESLIAGYGMSLWQYPEAGLPLVNDYFASLERIWSERTMHMAESIVVGMYPVELVGRGEANIVQLTEKWLAEHDKAPRALRRLVSENLDAAIRADKAQDTDRQWQIEMNNLLAKQQGGGCCGGGCGCR